MVRGLLDRSKARFNVSVAEVGFQSNPKRATVAVACVGSSCSVVRQTLEAVARLFASHEQAEVAEQSIDFL